MAPYRNVRYWLSDFHSGGKAVGKEEIFNQCHARLRNVIEHAFGVVKMLIRAQLVSQLICVQLVLLD